jgi:diguanylate cyclase (GGDEF)-like protein
MASGPAHDEGAVQHGAVRQPGGTRWSGWWRGLQRDRLWLKVIRELDRHVRAVAGCDTFALWARLPPQGEWLRVAWELRDYPVMLPCDVEPHASLQRELAPQRYITAHLQGPYRRLLDRGRVVGGWLLPLVSPEATRDPGQWVGVLGLGWRREPPEQAPSTLGLEPVVWYLLGQRLEDMYTQAVLEAAALEGGPAQAEDWPALMADLATWLGGDHWALFRLPEPTSAAGAVEVVAEYGQMANRGAQFAAFLSRHPELIAKSALFRSARQRRVVFVADTLAEGLPAQELRPSEDEEDPRARSLLVLPLGGPSGKGFAALAVYWQVPRGWQQFGLSLRPWEALRRVAADWWQDMHVAHDAAHDPLTGALNRLGMARAWQSTVSVARTGWLGVLDIDFFNEVNNRFGHLMGDDVLRVLAQILHSTAARRGGWFGRFGGDEFVLSLPEGTVWVEVGQEVQSSLDQHAQSRAWPQRITVSGGATRWHHPHVEWERVLARADRLLYRAKRGGRARFVAR